MAKKKRASTTKKTAARKKTAGTAKRAKKRVARKPAPDRVDLKSIRSHLAKDVDKLEKMSTRDPRAAVVRRQIEVMMMDLDRLCAPENPDGCGPHMVFPAESA